LPSWRSNEEAKNKDIQGKLLCILNKYITDTQERKVTLKENGALSKFEA